MPPENEEQHPDILNDLDMVDVQPPDEGVSMDSLTEHTDEKKELAQRGEEPAQEEEPKAEVIKSKTDEAESGQREESHVPVDPAQHAALQQSLTEEKQGRQRDREAMLREIIKLRRSRQQDASETPDTQEPVLPDNIPVQFDEKGQPFISRALLTTMMQGQVDPVRKFVGEHIRMAESIILEKPTERAPAHQRFRDAWTNLDEAVRLAQAEYDYYPSDIDGMIDLIEKSGLDKQFIESYPDVAQSSRDIEDFLQAASSMNPRRMRRMLDHIATSTNSQESKSEQQEGDGTIKQAEKLSGKPVPMRKHGAQQVPKMQSKLDVLDEKSPFDWTPDDRASFLKEMEAIDGKDI